MKKLLKRKLLHYYLKLADKIKDQAFAEILFLKLLGIMNYGKGGDFRASGEHFVIEYIKNFYNTKNNLVIFDVGANVGNYTKYLANIFGNNVQIFSFEPSNDTYQKLIENTKNIENVSLHNFGFSDLESEKKLYSTEMYSGLSSIYNRKLDHFNLSLSRSEVISLSTIDRFCIANNIEHIHFLKLDIEGHELFALNGASKMLSNLKIDFIQFEFGGCNIDSRTFFQDFYYLLKEKYKLYRILANGICEITSYKETYEIFITVNYLAIRKF